jgi:hypothetical protein
MSSVFKIDYKKLPVLLLPTFLRKSVLYRLLKAAIKPVVSLYDAFLTTRNQNNYTINQTGQVCYLRGLLNDAFDAELRRLYVADGEASDWIILYKKSLFTPTDSKHPLWLLSADEKQGETLLFRGEVRLVPKKGSVSAAGVDFMVMVPMVLRGKIDENRIISLVNFYKLASKRYTIQYY